MKLNCFESCQCLIKAAPIICFVFGTICALQTSAAPKDSGWRAGYSGLNTAYSDSMKMNGFDLLRRILVNPRRVSELHGLLGMVQFAKVYHPRGMNADLEEVYRDARETFRERELAQIGWHEIDLGKENVTVKGFQADLDRLSEIVDELERSPGFSRKIFIGQEVFLNYANKYYRGKLEVVQLALKTIAAAYKNNGTPISFYSTNFFWNVATVREEQKRIKSILNDDIPRALFAGAQLEQAEENRPFPSGKSFLGEAGFHLYLTVFYNAPVTSTASDSEVIKNMRRSILGAVGPEILIRLGWTNRARGARRGGRLAADSLASDTTTSNSDGVGLDGIAAASSGEKSNGDQTTQGDAEGDTAKPPRLRCRDLL